MTFNQIADALNRKGYLSARGRVFKGNHVHSTNKKSYDNPFLNHEVILLDHNSVVDGLNIPFEE